MKSQRKPFMPLDPEIDDDKLERLAQAKGVGKFEKPAAAATPGEGEMAEAVHTSVLSGEPNASEAGATPRSDMCKINFEAPGYLGTALKIDAATRQTSVRHVIMKALKDAGFAIKDEDMVEDGRRLRGSKVAGQS